MVIWKQVPLDMFEQNLETIMKTFRGAQVIVLIPPPVNETKEVEPEMRTNAGLQEYVAVLRRVAAAHSAALADATEHFLAMLGEQDYHHSDGLHMNELGQSVLNKTLIATIEKI